MSSQPFPQRDDVRTLLLLPSSFPIGPVLAQSLQMVRNQREPSPMIYEALRLYSSIQITVHTAYVQLTV